MNDITKIKITRTTRVREALEQLDAAGSGVLVLVNEHDIFERTVTDGDIRRLLIAGCTLDDNIMSLPRTSSVVLNEGFTRTSALELMNKHAINHLPVIDVHGHVVRLVDRREVDEHILLSTPHLGELERRFVEQAFNTNWIAPLGPNVDAFERELAEQVGIDHSAAVSSGTAAIHLALILLGVEPGDTVFCSALTFAASANPIVYQGAEPVFIDSEPDSWNLSPSALEEGLRSFKAKGRLPKAVIVVNLYGQSADYDPIIDVCNHYGVPIVEDAAESLGAFYKGKPSGSFGMFGIYSFNGNKIITTSGGGMLVSNDSILIQRARFLSTQAREPALHYEHKTLGYNYRMSNILAGIGRGQLRVLSERVEARRAVFERYRDGLSRSTQIQWMPEPAWSRSNRWLSTFTIRTNASKLSVNDVISHLAAERIEARPVWKPMQMQPVFSQCEYFTHEGQSVSQSIFESGVCLPSGSNMTIDQQNRILAILTQMGLNK